MSLRSILSEALHCNETDLKFTQKKLQSLWSNYGEVIELLTDVKGSIQHLVLKWVRPPKHLQNKKDLGHERKLKSYKVEVFVYNFLLKREKDFDFIIAKNLYCSFNDVNDETIMLFSDLRLTHDRAFARFTTEHSLQMAQCALRWLAAFHATFWHGHKNNKSQRADGVWRDGCFWHLQTRPLEYERINTRDAVSKAVKACAYTVDAMLRGCTFYEANSAISTGDILEGNQKYTTIVHGDYKDENILFNADVTACAVYDFQYCGHGYGSKDVVYHLVCSCDPNLLNDVASEQSILQYYFDTLLTNLNVQCSRGHLRKVDFEGFTFSEFKRQYYLAVIDFYRFQLGWGIWGNTSYLKRTCQKILLSPNGLSDL